jgi:lipopolysaccharide heptosyltransferase II
MTDPESLAWRRAEHVLCVRLDALGDLLMTTPALRALKQSRPGRRLTLLTSPSGAEAAALLPDIDGIIIYDAPWMKATAPRAGPLPDLAMIDRLRRGSFDAAVIFTVYSQNPLPSAMLCYLAEVPLRLAHCRENPYQLLTRWVPDLEPDRLVRHEVRRQLDLVAAVGCRTDDDRLKIRISEGDAGRARDRLGAIGLDPSGPWVLIHPGATAPSRRYPPEGFVEVATRLARDGMRVVFTGGPSEIDLIEGIRAAVPVPTHSLAGRLALGELAALIALAPLLIANNTGPVHVAAAVGTPVVDLYALTNPQHTPWAVPNRVLNHDVPCKYCYKSVCPEGHHRCLRLVTPETVVRAARELLDEIRAARETSTVAAIAGVDGVPRANPTGRDRSFIVP